jgi:molybdopterin/thiamine biosynthesis adenylyltransferase
VIDTIRHLDVFNPVGFRERVDVIGCGAIGSRIVLSLAKLGIENIHAWDFDEVAEHNMANQAFIDPTYIGRPKIIAISDMVKMATGIDIVIHDERVDGTQELGNVVFLAVDTMVARKEIWDKGLKLKPRTQLVIETRMGSDTGRVYIVDPCKMGNISEWEATLCSDDEAEVSACGASISVGPTAEIVSGLAVWQLIRWYSILHGHDDVLDGEIVVSLRPMMVLTRKFNNG